jgi:hypothetical protein
MAIVKVTRIKWNKEDTRAIKPGMLPATYDRLPVEVLVDSSAFFLKLAAMHAIEKEWGWRVDDIDIEVIAEDEGQDA